MASGRTGSSLESEEMATIIPTITDSGYAVYSKEHQCFFGINHCTYENPDSMVWHDDENKALMLLKTAQTYRDDTTWEVVEVEKSWSIKCQ